MYSGEIFEKMIGSDNWHGQKFKIHQEGVKGTTVDGEAIFWMKKDNGESHFHGRWTANPKPNQWDEGDEITLQSCTKK